MKSWYYVDVWIYGPSPATWGGSYNSPWKLFDAKGPFQGIPFDASHTKMKMEIDAASYAPGKPIISRVFRWTGKNWVREE